MRSEKEMYDLILGYANADENIRAVILNGSRANPNRKPDPFNDFDIVYLVRDLTPCKEKAYHKDFGEILVCERTDENELFEEHFPEFVCYLMQFADGNRIDLTVSSIDRWEVYCYGDRLSVVLLDKDNALPPQTTCSIAAWISSPPETTPTAAANFTIISMKATASSAPQTSRRKPRVKA